MVSETASSFCHGCTGSSLYDRYSSWNDGAGSCVNCETISRPDLSSAWGQHGDTALALFRISGDVSLRSSIWPERFKPLTFATVLRKNPFQIHCNRSWIDTFLEAPAVSYCVVNVACESIRKAANDPRKWLSWCIRIQVGTGSLLLHTFAVGSFGRHRCTRAIQVVVSLLDAPTYLTLSLWT